MPAKTGTVCEPAQTSDQTPSDLNTVPQFDQAQHKFAPQPLDAEKPDYGNHDAIGVGSESCRQKCL